MRLVNLAIKMRPFDGRGYEVRATILSQLGQREAEEYEMKQLYGDSEEEEEEDEERGGSDHLQAAAKDALAAFHLGGSSDLSLAGNAEDACRQASRLAAKMHYKDKMNKIRLGFSSPSSLPDAYDGGEDETKSAEESMPRQWLVQAYLCGYEPPSLALSVPVLPYREGQELFSLSLIHI